MGFHVLGQERENISQEIVTLGFSPVSYITNVTGEVFTV